LDWVFQFNPKRWDLKPVLEGVVLQDEWSVNQGRNLISPDDRVFFWQVGQEAELLAVGHVTSPIFERQENPFGRYAVSVAFDYRIMPPLTKQEALENEKLNKFRPFSGAMGTNFRIQDPEIVSELERVLKGRLIPLLSSATSQSSQQDVDAAIKRTNREVTNSLRKHITELEWKVFERLVRALLSKQGHTDVEVTKSSGDGGVDVRARLVAGGVASLRTCIQVKRQKSVGRPVVQALRGSLSSHETGLLITSGTFTAGALEEARDPTKAPIAMVDGGKLTELLIANGIGVRRDRVELYRLRVDDLTSEGLETVGEEDFVKT